MSQSTGNAMDPQTASPADEKIRALAALAQQRRVPGIGTRQGGFSRDYRRIEEFHDGFYDKHHWVSPWTISACNVRSPIMIAGQDWASESFLLGPADARQQALGHDPDLPTNKNLKYLLREAFDRELSEVFATNAFVFVKLGGMGTRIPLEDLRRSVETYTLREVEIVRPKMLLCIGAHTFSAFRTALGHSYQPLNRARYSTPEVTFQGTEIYGVPHVGARGLNSTGGRPKSLEIWQQLASRLRQL